MGGIEILLKKKTTHRGVEKQKWGNEDEIVRKRIGIDEGPRLLFFLSLLVF